MTTEYKNGVLKINDEGVWELYLFKSNNPVPDIHIKFRVEKMELDDSILPPSSKRGEQK